MRRLTEFGLGDESPVRPERVMPVVVGLLFGLAIALVLVGLATLVPVLASVLSGSASALTASTVVFLAVLAAGVVALRRAAPAPRR